MRKLSNILEQELDGEIVLLNMQTESYFGLNSSGTDIWKMLQEDQTLQNMFDKLVEEYDVEEDVFNNDFKCLITELIENKIIRII